MKNEHMPNKDMREKSEAGYGSLFNNDHAVMLMIDPESLYIVDANNAACKYYGWSSEEITRKKISHLNTLSEEKIRTELDKASNELQNHFFVKHRLANDEIRDVEVYAIPIKTEENTLICSIVHDISRRKRIEEELRLGEARLKSIIEILQSKHDSIQEFLDFTLNEAIKLTESKIGYIDYYSEKKEQFTLNTWSRDVMGECEITQPQTVYNLKETGIWGEAVRQRKTIIVNDFHASNPLKKGYPKGHVELHRFMTVPIFRKDKIVALIGVANKGSNYTEKDTLQLTLLMDSLWNITGRIGAEEALRKSEENYRGLFENDISGVAIHKIILDDEGNPIDYVFLEANEAFEKHTGLKVADIIGKRVTEVIPGIENGPFIERYGKVAITGIPICFEDLSEPLDRYYSINAYRVDKEIFATVFQDITERKLMEEELIRNQEKYHLLSDVTFEGIIIHEGGVVLEANEALTRITGYTREELLVKETTEIIFHPESVDYVRDQIINGIEKPYETRAVKKDGTIFPVEIEARNIMHEGSLIRVTALRDITERKKAEEALLYSEERYRSLFKEAPISILIHDKDTGEIIDANPTAYLTYGLSCLEELKENDFWLDPPYSFEDSLSLIHKASSEGVQQFEWLNRKITGELFWEHVRLSPVTINGIERIMATTIDITERKNADKALQEKKEELEKSRERFVMAVNGSQDGIWDWDLHNKEVYFSPRWKEMIGFEDAELQNKFSTFRNRIHPDDRQNVMIYLEKYLKGEIPDYRVEFRFLHKNGNYIWILTRGAALRDENGFPYRISGSHTDITERKRADEKIAEDTIRRRILIEQSVDGIVVVNQNGEVVEANQKYADMLGYSLEEVLQLRVWDWEHLASREKILEMIRDVDESGLYFETRHRRKDGTLLDVGVSSNGAILGDQKLSFCVCRDITERKRAEDELLQAKLDAEAANRTKSEFLANMSHELRTPLNSIYGFSQMLNDKIPGELNEKQARYVSHIMKSSRHLIELINDILDISKVEAGKMELVCENFAVADVIAETVLMMQPIAKRKNIDLITEIHVDNIELYADKKKVRDIMHNLLSNAIKFTAENGKVHVKASCQTNKMQISVSDSGIGISNDDQLKIFEPFKQVDSFLSRKYDGTGLGLAIVKRYVEMHGGDLLVESEVGKGSTFTFTVPSIPKKMKGYK